MSEHQMIGQLAGVVAAGLIWVGGLWITASPVRNAYSSELRAGRFDTHAERPMPYVIYYPQGDQCHAEWAPVDQDFQACH